MHTPTKHEVETFSGLYVDTEFPAPETIRLEDIAHGLSQLCRYNGQCRTFYSIAEHAVMVSRRLEALGMPLAWCMGGLHHDDAEAYLGDVTRPLKLHLGERYTTLSDRMDAAVAEALGLDERDFHLPQVKDADTWALFVEARHLLPSGGVNWSGSSLDWDMNYDLHAAAQVDPPYWTGGLPPVEAEGLFLSRHHELTR